MPGVRLNFSKSGIGFSMGRPCVRIGIDAKRKKYFSAGLPGTGFSYRTFCGSPVAASTPKKAAFAIVVAGLLLAALVVLAIKKG
jgi:hypothetical protein